MSWWGNGMKDGDPLFLEECETPKSRQEYEKIVEDTLKEVLQLEKKNDWRNLSFKDPAVELYDLAMDGSDLKLIKTNTILNGSPQEIFDYLCNDDTIEHRQKWEPELLELTTIEDFKDFDVVFQAYKAPYPISSRSFVAVRAKRKLTDGTLVSFGKSVNHEKCPYNSNYVRGVVTSAVFVRPIPGERYKADCCRLVQLDPKGSIPTWAVNWGINKAGEGIVALRRLIDKESKNWVRTEEEQEGGAEEPAEGQIEVEEEEEPVKVTRVERKRAGSFEREVDDETGQEFWETSSFLDAEALEQYLKPLQESFRSVEKTTTDSAGRLEETLKSIEQQQKQLQRAVQALGRSQGRQSGLFGSMPVSGVVFLLAWPVVVVTAYDAYSRYKRKT